MQYQYSVCPGQSSSMYAPDHRQFKIRISRLRPSQPRQPSDDSYMPARLNISRPASPLRTKPWLEELLRRRRLRDSAGSAGLRPLARACRFKMSVRLTTPTSRPDSLAPGRAEAGMDGASGAARLAATDAGKLAELVKGWGGLGRWEVR